MTLLVLLSTNKESESVYMYCCRCGKELSKYWLLCPACGNTVMITENTVVHTESSIPQKRKWVTLLLAIFLGCLGVHRFYVGKWKSGLLWLLTGGFCGLGWGIDMVLILLGRLEDSEGRGLI